MLGGRVLGPVVRIFNTGMTALLHAPGLGRFVGRGIVVISYTGRRSGRRFTLPVAYRRVGAELTVNVEFPDVKGWWRNFTGDGGAILLRLDGADRTGHAVARRDGPRRVIVTVRLDEPRTSRPHAPHSPDAPPTL